MNSQDYVVENILEDGQDLEVQHVDSLFGSFSQHTIERVGSDADPAQMVKDILAGETSDIVVFEGTQATVLLRQAFLDRFTTADGCAFEKDRNLCPMWGNWCVYVSQDGPYGVRVSVSTTNVGYEHTQIDLNDEWRAITVDLTVAQVMEAFEAFDKYTRRLTVCWYTP